MRSSPNSTADGTRLRLPSGKLSPPIMMSSSRSTPSGTAQNTVFTGQPCGLRQTSLSSVATCVRDSPEFAVMIAGPPRLRIYFRFNRELLGQLPKLETRISNFGNPSVFFTLRTLRLNLSVLRGKGIES
jgi:hypothetical protein